MTLDTKLIQQQIELIAGRIPTAYFMAVSTIDGFPIAIWRLEGTENPDVYERGEERDLIFVTGSVTKQMCERILEMLNGGRYRYNVLQGEEATLFALALGEDYILSFGVRKVWTVDSTWVILQQWWGELLKLLDVPTPRL